MPQNGPGPIPENSNIFKPFNGPIINYWKTLNFTSIIGNKVNELINANNSAIAVKMPNNAVGAKLDINKIEKPTAIVNAV